MQIHTITLKASPYEPKGQGFESLAARHGKGIAKAIPFLFVNQLGLEP